MVYTRCIQVSRPWTQVTARFPEATPVKGCNRAVVGFTLSDRSFARIGDYLVEIKGNLYVIPFAVMEEFEAQVSAEYDCGYDCGAQQAEA